MLLKDAKLLPWNAIPAQVAWCPALNMKKPGAICPGPGCSSDRPDDAGRRSVSAPDEPYFFAFFFFDFLKPTLPALGS